MNWFAHAALVIAAADPNVRLPAAIGPNDEDLWEVELIVGKDPDDADPPPDENEDSEVADG